MVDDGIWTTNVMIVAKAVINASSTSSAVGETDKYVLQVEATVNVATRHNWSDAYSTLNVDVKHMLDETTSNLCAIYVIINDMSGFTSRVEAEDMINTLNFMAQRNIAILRNSMSETFMVKA